MRQTIPYLSTNEPSPGKVVIVDGSANRIFDIERRFGREGVLNDTAPSGGFESPPGVSLPEAGSGLSSFSMEVETMGYTTHYTLVVTEIPTTRATPEEAIEDLRETNEEAAYCLDTEGLTCEGGKWYEHESHLLEFSKRYPHLLFKLSGEGEENDDMWDKYYLNGKVQVAKAQIMKPEFDMEKLL